MSIRFNKPLQGETANAFGMCVCQTFLDTLCYFVSYKKEVKHMQKEVREAFRIHFKWTVLEYAKVCRTVAKACREFEVPRSTFYNWKKAFYKEGKSGLARKKPIARNHPRSLAQDVVDKILHLRQIYKLGPERITWYL
jgi:transposase-like protein